jgi:hypothetical protein
MPSELTNEELALWCEDMGKVFVEVAAKHSGDKLGEPVRNAFTIVAERLRKPPDSSRVRETAKELPGDYDNVLVWCSQGPGWLTRSGLEVRTRREERGDDWFTHWMPLPPAPKGASDVG